MAGEHGLCHRFRTHFHNGTMEQVGLLKDKGTVSRECCKREYLNSDNEMQNVNDNGGNG